MSFSPYLTFDGNCQEAFEFYVEVLGAEIVMSSKFSEAPEGSNMSGELDDKIMHARLKLGDSVIMASDDPTGNYSPPNGFHISAGFDDLERARGAFEGLSDGGQVMMPFRKTFWTEGFGMVRDRFGIPWMVNFNNPESEYY